MNCCDEYGNCNQGRNCPVRVAKYKPVMLAADPLPPSIWRDQLKRLGYWVLMAVLGMLWLSFLMACTYVYAN
jgi:hypothetical protein